MGLPTEDEMRNMSKQMSNDTIKLVHRLDDIPKKDFKTILPRDSLTEKERSAAADLLEKLLKWDPNERLSCEQALKHEFFTMKMTSH